MRRGCEAFPKLNLSQNLIAKLCVSYLTSGDHYAMFFGIEFQLLLETGPNKVNWITDQFVYSLARKFI